MSLSQVCSLENLCLRNIAFHIVKHGQKLKNSQTDDEILVRYESLKRIFWSDLIKELYRIHQSKEDNNNEQLNQLLRFVFCKVGSNFNNSTKLGLEFLFNEYTFQLRFSASQHPVISHLLHFALSRCKNLKAVVLKFYCFVPAKWISPLPCRYTIIKVDILYSSVNNRIVIDLLRLCPSVKVFKASGKSISSSSLYGLCSNCHIRDNLSACDGYCCDTGKRIRYLVLYSGFGGFSQGSIACALKHLPSLEVFCDTYHGAFSEISNIPHGINLLKKEALKTSQVPIDLNLTKLFFGRWTDITTILNALQYCPRIKAFCYEVSASTLSYFTFQSYEALKSIYVHQNVESKLMCHQFQQFLTVKGWQLETVSLNSRGRYNESLDVKCIYNIISHCKNLKNLFLTTTYVRCDQNENLLLEVQNTHNILQKISLIFLFCDDESAMEFFVNLFSVSKELKHVGLSYNSGKNILNSAVNRNGFPRLENLVIHGADLENCSVMPLIHRESCLRNITLISCTHAAAFINEHHQASQNYGFGLHIDSFGSDRLGGLDHHCFLNEE